MSTVQLPGAKWYDKQMVMHTGYCSSDVSLAREFQKHLSSAIRKHGVIFQVKLKRASKLKWTTMEYLFQNDAYVAHKYVNMFFNTNQFPSLPFCGTHTKPHCDRGLSNH